MPKWAAGSKKRRGWRIVSQKRTVAGVMGSTGAGKSSVINAVLGGEMLVPTNCMRACTAVITEIAYNDSQDPEALYRAKVEFISKEDWRKELTIMFSDLFDNQGALSPYYSSEDSEVGIAYAKLRAAYPHFTTKDIS